MKKRAIVVFSGYNQRAIISFCRVAHKQNIPFIIIAKSESDSIFDTKYKAYVEYIREFVELDFTYIKGILKEIKKKNFFEEYVILPSSEALNRFLLDHREALEEIGFKTPLVDKRTYELISDKYKFGNLCKENNIKVPMELEFEEDMQLPVVIKPKEYVSRDGQVISPHIIENHGNLEKFIANHDMGDFYIQQYISGESYYLLYYFSKDGSYEAFSQQNILQQGHGKSMIAAISSHIHEQEIAREFAQLFKNLGFTGLVMVELKHQKGEYFMIEANPRLWGPSQLFVDSNCNFFELFLRDWGFSVSMDDIFHGKMQRNYFWFGGLIESLYNNEKIAFHIDNVDFMKEQFKDFLSSDVYLREDTKNVFTSEILQLKRRAGHGHK